MQALYIEDIQPFMEEPQAAGCRDGAKKLLAASGSMPRRSKDTGKAASRHGGESWSTAPCGTPPAAMRLRDCLEVEGGCAVHEKRSRGGVRLEYPSPCWTPQFVRSHFDQSRSASNDSPRADEMAVILVDDHKGHVSTNARAGWMRTRSKERMACR